MWDDILGHEQNKEFLARLLQPGNRPHALLFYGPEGIGKKQLALRFAKTFLCQKPDETSLRQVRILPSDQSGRAQLCPS